MKIYKGKNGKLIIDGENHTHIYPKRGEEWFKNPDNIEIELITHFYIEHPKELDTEITS